jgi:hypothetical protein
MPRLTGLDDIHKAAQHMLEFPKLMSQSTTDAADLIDDVIQEDFDAGVNPYGEPWAPLRPATLAKGRTPPPLTDEGLLRAVNVEPLQGAGLKIEFDEDYAVYHQTGTSRMAQRLILPEESRGLPERWNDAVVEAMNNAVNGWAQKLGWRASGYGNGGRLTGRE